MTETEKVLTLALQRIYYRGNFGMNEHHCVDGDCPNREIAVELVGLAHEALMSSGMEGKPVGRVGLIRLKRGST